jgi:hypothetical protein
LGNTDLGVMKTTRPWIFDVRGYTQAFGGRGN